MGEACSLINAIRSAEFMGMRRTGVGEAVRQSVFHCDRACACARLRALCRAALGNPFGKVRTCTTCAPESLSRSALRKKQAGPTPEKRRARLPRLAVSGVSSLNQQAFGSAVQRCALRRRRLALLAGAWLVLVAVAFVVAAINTACLQVCQHANGLAFDLIEAVVDEAGVAHDAGDVRALHRTALVIGGAHCPRDELAGAYGADGG